MIISNLAEKLKVSDKTIKRDIEKLKEQNKIERIGSDRNGTWQTDGKF